MNITKRFRKLIPSGSVQTQLKNAKMVFSNITQLRIRYLESPIQILKAMI